MQSILRFAQSCAGLCVIESCHVICHISTPTNWFLIHFDNNKEMFRVYYWNYGADCLGKVYQASATTLHWQIKPGN